MLHKILSFFRAKPEANHPRPLSFSASVNQAYEFTLAEGFQPDAFLTNKSVDTQQVAIIASEVARGLYDQIKQYRFRKQNEHMSLGGDCGNVHYLISQFIRENYKDVDANFTMGNVTIDQRWGFEFSEEKFRRWVSTGHGSVFDCHSWVTLGKDHIIDATIATYVNTRRQKVMKFGGVLYGTPGSLKCIPIVQEPHRDIPIGTTIIFEPVVFGIPAFHCTARQDRHYGA